MENESNEPSADEQAAFSEAHELATRLIADGLNGKDVAHGLLIAAIAFLRKVDSDTMIAKILYEYERSEPRRVGYNVTRADTPRLCHRQSTSA